MKVSYFLLINHIGINEVVKKSVAFWKKEDTVIDDITIVLATLSPSGNETMQTLQASANIQSHKEFKLKPNFYNLNN